MCDDLFPSWHTIPKVERYQMILVKVLSNSIHTKFSFRKGSKSSQDERYLVSIIVRWTSQLTTNYFIKILVFTSPIIVGMHQFQFLSILILGIGRNWKELTRGVQLTLTLIWALMSVSEDTHRSSFPIIWRYRWVLIRYFLKIS